MNLKMLNQHKSVVMLITHILSTKKNVPLEQAIQGVMMISQAQ